MGGEFFDKTKPTRSCQQITDTFVMNKKRVQLVIHDTPAKIMTQKNRYYANNDHFNSQAAVVVVDATDKDLLETLRRWDTAIKDNYSQAKTKMLVINKCDQVFPAQAIYRLARKQGYKHIIYASAKENRHVATIFNTAARCVIQAQLARHHLKQRLKAYIRTIESYVGDGEHSKKFTKYQGQKNIDTITINFSHDFSIFKSSQAANREANYRMARKLLKRLEASDTTVVALFATTNIHRLRKAIIQKHTLHTWRRGIHSETLNSVIDDAEDMAQKMNEY